jgi:hypothetical protein
MFANHVRNWSINLRIFLRKSVKYDWGDHLPLDLFLLFHWWSYLPSSYHYHYHEQYVYVLSLEKFYYSTRKGIVQILIMHQEGTENQNFITTKDQQYQLELKIFRMIAKIDTYVSWRN